MACAYGPGAGSWRAQATVRPPSRAESTDHAMRLWSAQTTGDQPASSRSSPVTTGLWSEARATASVSTMELWPTVSARSELTKM